ncbi:hypothetical protein AWR27_05725 [Spirosoma montaniterrae]|uniref:Uncharacterized protein n=1 Tax=Spirosoma montaniterrae TaxID=1178516 RepID=A0A1P9WU17_9BACT|nr:hypothetical protein AWR27_05725 [Spirosoma montaniterrae]
MPEPKKSAYKESLRSAFNANHGGHIPVGGELYGLVYHFYREDNGIDADNLSKPIWDCLKGVLFEDDRQVKLRIAGSFDLTKNDFAKIDSTGLPGLIVTQFLDALNNETENHILYVECGVFNADMVKLNMNRYGN